MSEQQLQAIRDYFEHSSAALARVAADPGVTATIALIASRLTQAFRAGGKLLIAGNGGSAGDAQHIAAEFVGRFGSDRDPMPAIALTTDTSALTAIGNDYGFEQVFERQVRALGRTGDVFLAISTSGNSANILAALKSARTMSLLTIGFCGAGHNAMQPLCDIVLPLPGERTRIAPASAVIQQVYMTTAHLICGLVEQDMFETGSR